MSKGDVIRLTVRVGETSRDYEIKADKDGRKLEVKRGKRVVIQVQTRYGGVVRSVEVDPAMVLVLDKTVTESRARRPSDKKEDERAP